MLEPLMWMLISPLIKLPWSLTRDNGHVAYGAMALSLPLRLLHRQEDFTSSSAVGSCTKPKGTTSLCSLPCEIMLLILADLELEDHFRLSLSCQHFQFIIRSDAICRATLRVGSVVSMEATEK